MNSFNQTPDMISAAVPSGFHGFTFVPVLQKLPLKTLISEEWTPGVITRRDDESAVTSHETISEETMSEIFKAEMVFIKDSSATEGRGEGGNVLPSDKQLKMKPSTNYASLSGASSSGRTENTSNHITAGRASMETAVDQHRGISQWQCQDTLGRAEVSSGCFANRVSEDRKSPTFPADLCPTTASSRESLLSDVWDKDKSWCGAQLSSVASPVSISRTVSPCSSVRSGVFTPCVTQIKKHFLAPGSSLVHIPQTCFSSCESLSSSVCPQSPPPRHRPPLTRLSLLTAILRKGRLPVLSSALQRPYTPCWPVNPVTLSFCKACSAASSVASIPMEFSSHLSSSVSIDSQPHVHRDDNRCVISPSSVQSSKHSITCPQSQVKRCCEQSCFSPVPQSERGISPPPTKGSKLPRAPLSLLCSNFKSASPAEHQEIVDCATSKQLHHKDYSLCPSSELKSGVAPVPYVKNNLKNYGTRSDSSVPQKQRQRFPSSLSKLHLLSQKLRCAPVYHPHLQPPVSHSPNITTFTARTDAPSPPPPPPPPPPLPQSSMRRCERSCTASQGPHQSPCLSPSRYTPITFLGWPSPSGSPTPTPSPAPPIRDLTPSPSLSLRSTTPSPRPGSGISDCSDREGKKRKTHKIKLSYKSLAAIPTNTLLLDQQAIDEQVERTDSPGDTMDRVDTHAEMCSPAQLRQESEELYATIDEILANSSAAPSKSSSTNIDLQQINSLQKTLGRETKYASVGSLHQPGSLERKLLDPRKTKPGVIRPMTAIPRLTVEGEEEFYKNPFRQTLSDFSKVFLDVDLIYGLSVNEADRVSPAKMRVFMSPKSARQDTGSERRSPFSPCELRITESGNQNSHSVKAAPALAARAEERRAASETHI